VRGVDESRMLPVPDLWGFYDLMTKEESKMRSEKNSLVKHYQDFTIIRSKNPYKSGDTFDRSLELTKDLPVSKFSFAAERANSICLSDRKKDDEGKLVSFVAEPPSRRYMTSGGFEPITHYALEYADETRIPKMPFSHCTMQRYFKLSSSPLTDGMGVHSLSYNDGNDGSGGTISLKEKQAVLNIDLAPAETEEKYIIYIVISTLKILEFREGSCEMKTASSAEQLDHETAASAFNESRFL